MKTLTKEQIKKIRKNPNEQNWYSLSQTYKLSEEFIREFKKHVKWGYISKYQKLSEEFIREFSDKLDWHCISKHQKLSEEFIIKFNKRIRLTLLNKQTIKGLSSKFIVRRLYKPFKNYSNLNFSCVVKYCVLDDYLMKHLPKILLEDISCHRKLKESFIEKYSDKVDWPSIFCNQKLSESFILKFKDKKGFDAVFIYQELSEDFIRNHIKNVNGIGALGLTSIDNICQYQKLSYNFIRDFKDNLYWPFICNHQVLSEDFIRELKDYVNWTIISRFQKLSEDFIWEFAEKIDEFKLNGNPFISDAIKKEFVEYKNAIKNTSDLSDVLRLNNLIITEIALS